MTMITSTIPTTPLFATFALSSPTIHPPRRTTNLQWGSANQTNTCTPRQLKPILALAVPGVILSTVLTACILRFVLHPYHERWNWNASLTTGAILSATDPVAVVALMKELGVSERLGTLMEGESLLNDGTAIVVFNVFYNQLLKELGACSADPVSHEGGVVVVNQKRRGRLIR
jgi:hypothetical protein